MSRIDLILAEALELSDDERAQLALRLAESLTPTPAPSAHDAWVGEIARRIERLRDGTARTVSAQDALSMARAALAARRA